MRNFKTAWGALLPVAALLICLAPISLFAEEEEEEFAPAPGPPPAPLSAPGVTTSTGTTPSRVGGAPASPTISEKPSASDNAALEKIGLGIFTRLPFRLSASVHGGYDDNVSTSDIGRQKSAFTDAGVALTYDFGSPRTQLSLATGAGLTYYYSRPMSSDDYDINAYLNLSLTHKATPRLTLKAAAYATYQTEPDFTFTLGINRRTGNYFYSSDKLEVTYLWTRRFSTETSYTLSAIKYDDSSIGFFQDLIQNTFGNEFRLLLVPTTTLVGEYRFEIISYDQIPSDSQTHFLLGGFDHQFSPRLSASFRGGAEFRKYDQTQPDGNDKNSPYFEGTVRYALGKNTTIDFSNRYGFEEPGNFSNQNRATFRSSLRLKHDFTSRISATLGGYYAHDDYSSVDTPTLTIPGFVEQSFDVVFTLRYALTRYLGLEGGFSRTEVTSDFSTREYSRNRGWAGINLSF